ncbi:Hcp family type VI secretion system effector [Paraburkholderia hayleyella]|uniref:Hcp family type VI secretion system effector n=1 Tax=Paraburkholderia hayleyella TaxID=2152889 RepID=UPI001291C548|nr:Hcp family type VI secretion system effector [Paraburkholderia hayleyella]
MPMPCYLTLEGPNGKIDGSCEVEPHKGKIEVQAAEMAVELPRNPQTGLPAGKRQHLGLSITKVIDKSSPKIFQALCSGQQMKSGLLEFYRTSPQGKEEKYYTIKVSNAAVVSVRDWVPNCLDPENKQMGHMETVSLTYEKIVVTWVKDGIEAEDDWLNPKA